MTAIKSNFIVTSAFMILFIGASWAQESVIASGNDISGSGGTVAYSIGQLTTETISGSTGSIEQGVQHAYELVVMGNTDVIKASLAVFPNPTRDYLMLRIDDWSTDLFYKLYDIQGKVIREEKIVNQKTTLDMTQLAPASYLLDVMDQNENKQTFKIIKNL